MRGHTLGWMNVSMIEEVQCQLLLLGQYFDRSMSHQQSSLVLRIYFSLHDIMGHTA